MAPSTQPKITASQYGSEGFFLIQISQQVKKSECILPFKVHFSG